MLILDEPTQAAYVICNDEVAEDMLLRPWLYFEEAGTPDIYYYPDIAKLRERVYYIRMYQ